MATTGPTTRSSPLRLGRVLRSPHAEQRGFSGFRPRSVPVGLNRTPDDRETAVIEGVRAQVGLAAAGYPGVSLQVVGSQLEVAGTTVADLDDELMRVLAGVIESANAEEGPGRTC